jgi:predicted N-acetyltransferase YhbS
LLDETFGVARFGKSVERLRAGRLPAHGLALAAKDAGDLVGTLRMWHILAGEVPALLLRWSRATVCRCRRRRIRSCRALG